MGGHAWDAVMLLKAAIEKGGATTEGIRAGLEGLKDFHVLAVPLTFSGDHAV